MDIKDGFLLMVYKFFDTKSASSGVNNDRSLDLAEELHKPIIQDFSVY